MAWKFTPQGLKVFANVAASPNSNPAEKCLLLVQENV